MRLVTKDLQLLLNTRILSERLNEAADGIKRGEIHFLLEVLEVTRWKSLIDPLPVIFKIEIGNTDQKVVGTEAVEGREPGSRRFKVVSKHFDIGRLWRHHTPAKDANGF